MEEASISTGAPAKPAEEQTASTTPPSTATKPGVGDEVADKAENQKSGDQRSKVWVGVIGAFGFLFLIWLAHALVSWTALTPATFRPFVALGASAAFLVIMGLTTLISIIPATALNPDVKTEFFSARAAYICVLAGLILLGIVGIGAAFAQVVLVLGEF